jgi:hypothetical protein
MLLGWCSVLHGATGQLELKAIDKESGDPIPCRMHLKTAKGQPKRPEKVPYWNDHFALPGKLLLKLPLGNYSFELERGLEYLDQSGTFTINVFADDSKMIEMTRFVDMAAEHWYSGDLDIRRPPGEIELIMQADDLHLGEVVTWGNEKPKGKEAVGKESPANKELKKEAVGKEASANKELKSDPVVFDKDRCYRLLAGTHSCAGGEIGFHRLEKPIKLADKQSPSLLLDAIEAKKRENAWIDVANPASWDMPALVALGLADSIQIADGRICREKIVPNESGRPRDKKKFPEPLGGIRWSQELYFKLLECGFRLPPTAGSASGASPNPVGYNRVYVFVEDEFNYENWWDGLRDGRALVTNGPLMRISVEGQLPGHVFGVAKGQKLELEIALTLSTREEIHYLEIIKNGGVEKSIRMDDYIEDVKNNKLPKLDFDESGWFLVRAVCDSAKSYRFAMTAPYFVSIGDRPRVSKKAAQFFLDWVSERAKQFESSDKKEIEEVADHYRKAIERWIKLVAEATAE